MNESILTKPFLASVGIEGFVIAVMTMVGFRSVIKKVHYLVQWHLEHYVFQD
ncbi:MAG: hypothetical protein ACLRQF_04075 [Thomasclavelia ramosa]